MYEVGYTTGVFDLFHVGHLNILRKSKEKCQFLIVGVRTDELALELKSRLPTIHFKQRMEIIQSIRYVEKVLPEMKVDKEYCMSSYLCYRYVANKDIIFKEGICHEDHEQVSNDEKQPCRTAQGIDTNIKEIFDGIDLSKAALFKWWYGFCNIGIVFAKGGQKHIQQGVWQKLQSTKLK